MTARERFQAMPVLLKFVCVACLLSGVFMPLSACLPFATFEIFDEKVTGRELWAYGYGPFVLLTGIGLLAAGVGLLQGRNWSRWLIVFLHTLLIPLAGIYWLRRRDNLSILLFEIFVLGGLWAGFFFWYLFRRQRSLFS